MNYWSWDLELTIGVTWMLAFGLVRVLDLAHHIATSLSTGSNGMSISNYLLYASIVAPACISYRIVLM